MGAAPAFAPRHVLGVFARFPLGRNRPSDKKSRKIKMLEQVLIAKVSQLLRNLL